MLLEGGGRSTTEKGHDPQHPHPHPPQKKKKRKRKERFFIKSCLTEAQGVKIVTTFGVQLKSPHRTTGASFQVFETAWAFSRSILT